MKSGIAGICFVAFSFCASGLFLPGCTYNRVQLPDGKTFAVERIPSSPLYVSRVHAEQRNHEMVIRGELTGGSSYARGTGHVDLAVIGPGGEILGKTSVGYSPKTIGRKGSARQPRFEAYFPFIPPDGSSIRVALHNDGGPALGEVGYDCGNNRAGKENQPG